MCSLRPTCIVTGTVAVRCRNRNGESYRINGAKIWIRDAGGTLHDCGGSLRDTGDLGIIDHSCATTTTTAGPSDSPPAYECTHLGCGWSGIENVHYGYFADNLDVGSDCPSCQAACTADPNCGSVECGLGYCSWWATGMCAVEEATQPFMTCRPATGELSGSQRAPLGTIYFKISRTVSQACVFWAGLWAARAARGHLMHH